MTGTRQSHGAQLMGNAFWNGSPTVLRLAVGFFLVPFIIAHIETDLLSIWRFSLSLLSASWLLQLGLSSAVSREVPQGLVRKDYHRISEVVSTTVGFNCILSLVLLAATASLVVKFPDWFDVAQENRTTSRIVIGITGLGFAIWIPFVIWRAVIHGLQSFISIGIVEISSTILYAFFVVWALKADGGVVALTALGLGRVLLPAVALAMIARKICPHIKLAFRNARVSVFGSILPYSVNSFIYTIATMLFAQASIWVAGALLGVSIVLYYSVCQQLATMIGAVLAVTLVVSKPAASEFQAQGDMARVRALFLRSMKYVVMAAMPPALFLCVFHHEVLLAWIGKEEFAAYSYLVPILALTQVAWLCQQAGYYVINGIGRHRPIAAMAVGSMVTSVVLAVILVKVASLGLLGIALGVSIPTVIVSGVLVPVYSCRVLEIPLVQYLKACLLRSAVPIVLFLAFIAGWKMMVERSELWQLLVCLAAGGSIVLAGYWCIALSKNERSVFVTLLAKVVRRS